RYSARAAAFSRFIPAPHAIHLLIFRVIEVIVRDVWHKRLFPIEGAWGGWRQAALRMDALDVGCVGKNADAFRGPGLQQQPRDGMWVYRAAGKASADHFATAVALPGRAGEVDA